MFGAIDVVQAGMVSGVMWIVVVVALAVWLVYRLNQNRYRVYDKEDVIASGVFVAMRYEEIPPSSVWMQNFTTTATVIELLGLPSCVIPEEIKVRCSGGDRVEIVCRKGKYWVVVLPE